MNPFDEVVRGELHHDVMRVIAKLRPNERVVVILRFGLDKKGYCTLREVAQIIGVGRERVRQIEAKALRKLRHPALAQVLRPFLKGPSRDYL